MRIWICSAFALALLTSCAGGSIKRTIDASAGAPSVSFTVSVEGSAFLGASPAALFREGALVADIKRGETVRVSLPCGTATYATAPAGGSGKAYEFPTRTLVLNPCDGALTSLHISFQAFHGFALSRER